MTRSLLAICTRVASSAMEGRCEFSSLIYSTTKSYSLAVRSAGAIIEMGNAIFQLLTRKGYGKVYLAVFIPVGFLMITQCSAGAQQVIYLLTWVRFCLFQEMEPLSGYTYQLEHGTRVESAMMECCTAGDVEDMTGWEGL